MAKLDFAESYEIDHFLGKTISIPAEAKAESFLDGAYRRDFTITLRNKKNAPEHETRVSRFALQSPC